MKKLQAGHLATMATEALVLQMKVRRYIAQTDIAYLIIILWLNYMEYSSTKIST